MRFELHCDGQILHSTNLNYLIELAQTIPYETVLYKIVQSKFPSDTCETKIVTRKPKRFTAGVKEILPYKDAQRCWELEKKGKSRIEIARQMYCSTDKLRITMQHYDYTMSQDEYENTQPFKKINLLISK
jgi:hypothetical protein